MQVCEHKVVHASTTLVLKTALAMHVHNKAKWHVWKHLAAKTVSQKYVQYA